MPPVAPPVSPPVPPAPAVPPPPAVLPRQRREADPEPAPPWDPRGPGTTGYGLGSVTVPPALPEVPPEPPVWRWGAPPERPRDADNATPPPPAPARDPGADSWPGADRRDPFPGTGGEPPQGDGAGRAADAAGPGATVPDAAGPAPRAAREPSPGSDPVPDPRSGMEPPAPWEAPGGPGPWPAEAEADAAAPVAVQPLAGDPVAGEPWSASGAGAGERPLVGFLGDRAPTYAPEPGSLPLADPAALEELVPDTVLEGARHGTYTLRATSVRGDSARFRGEARRDFLLTARFGTGDDALVLAALAGGDRSATGAADAAAELCRWIASAVGRSRERLADDIRAGRRDALRSGLQRLTDRGYGRLRAHAAELGLPEDAYTAGLRVLLLPIDPECKTRVCFGSGAGGLFRLRDGAWQDLEPEAPEGGAEGFRFRAAVARPRDTLLLCSGGLADPMREEGLLPAELAARWADPEPPGLAAFLADTQLRLKGYADDRTAAAVWEA
ncbi:protein phosphatase 2C domain-containing protein [Streptomyces vinaceus]|uniref:protein phosphatase 2C domain-containing protein n=1 Tax=Streptomyces vinaceus TaxID=1960 RepID=UPI0037FF0848